MNSFFLGDGAVGKTSLLLTYIRKGFPTTYNPTVVDNYQTVLKLGRNGERILNLDVWDTAGQEDFENIRQLSYSKTHGIALFSYSL